MMAEFFRDTLDLRLLESDKLHSAIAQRANLVEPDRSFWLIADHDPLELHEYFNELGFSVTTYVPCEGEYWVFMGRVR